MVENASISMILYDEQFSIEEWKTEIKKKKEQTDSVLDTIKQALSSYTENNDDFRLVVDIDEDFKRAYKAGDIKLLVGKDGDIFAQKLGKNGRFGKKLPIKEELVKQGVSTEEVLIAAQSEAMMELLNNIIDTLEDIDSKITTIIQGQRNDRLGMYYSAISMYIESKGIGDDMLRKQMIAQALRALSESGSQMMQEMRTDIQYLVSKDYMKEKKRVEKIKERMDRIREDFNVIYKSYLLKAMIFFENNETVAMLTVIGEYGKFINQMIVPYAPLLTECDPTDTLLVGGLWEKRAETLIECDNISKIANNTPTLYLIKETKHVKG